MTSILCRESLSQRPTKKKKKIIGPFLLSCHNKLVDNRGSQILCVIQQLHTSSLLPISFDIVQSFITNSVFQ